jgi:uncharacterized membrane protein (DUF373 family)
VEDGIHILVAALLVMVAVLLVVDTTRGLVSQLMRPYDALSLVLTVLDKTLVLFIVAELLHTVRITIQKHTLDAGPFFVVGLIAGIRRVLTPSEEHASNRRHVAGCDRR